MFRQSSSRNHRSRGLRLRYALQIGLLLAVCLWLLYQVKHSHDKKKTFDESNAKIAGGVDETGLLHLGRKDVSRKKVPPSSYTENHHTKVNEEEEEEIKHEDIDDDVRDGEGGNEIDEHIDDRAEEELNNQVELGSHEEKKEDNEHLGNKGKGDEEVGEDSEVREESNEMDASVEIEGSKQNTQEAREAQYNGDNASSAVIREKLKSESGGEESLKLEEEHRGNFLEDVQENIPISGTTDVAVNIDGNSFISSLVHSTGENQNDSFLVAGTVGSAPLNTADVNAVVDQSNSSLSSSWNWTYNNLTTGYERGVGQNNVLEGDSKVNIIELDGQNYTMTNLSETNLASHTLHISDEKDSVEISHTDNTTTNNHAASNQEHLNFKSDYQNGTAKTSEEHAGEVIGGLAEHFRLSTLSDNFGALTAEGSDSKYAVMHEEMKDALADLGTLPEVEGKDREVIVAE